MRNADTPSLLNPTQAAEFLGRTVGTLSIWRCTRRYDIPYIKVGRSVMYDLADLVTFLEERKIRRAKCAR